MRDYFLKLNHLLAESCGWLLSAVTVLIVIDFVARGLGHPIFGVSEMAMFSMVCAVYFGLAHCEETDSHVRVEAVLIRLPVRVQRASMTICHLLSVVTVFGVAYAVGLNALGSFLEHEAVSGPVPLPIYPVKFAITLALVVYGIQVVLNTIEWIRSPRALSVS
ncbi:TRAP transporter small permease [Oleispirillum naphthae]|uniref:TRAP transporter small permease subunit n=1 Tax=Oleispirillum naphthae TaxID=2838853 RepID=UPI0030822409